MTQFPDGAHTDPSKSLTRAMDAERQLYERSLRVPDSRITIVATGSLRHYFVDGLYWTTVHEEIFTNAIGAANLRELRESWKRLAARIMEGDRVGVR